MNSFFDFENEKYNGLKADILKYRDIQGHSWEEIKALSFLKGDYPLEMALHFLTSNSGYSPGVIGIEEWKRLVEEMEKKDEVQRVVKLGANSKNDAKISADPGSQWQQYRNKLIKKGFSENSIRNIQESSFEILQQLDADTLNQAPTKGLVVGNVQSGKTANMTGLISMAADYGFNYFIVFSGVIEKLRQQTANRLYSDLNSNGNLSWTSINNPSITQRDPIFRWENIDLSEISKKRYLTVCLKNKKRIESLRNWLYSDENKLKQLKVLIIDDEADQASINTKDIESEDEDRTVINKAIVQIVNGYKGKKLRASNYISYTATPYANVLNESGPDSLYPKDFIFSLVPSEDYIGPKEIFGIQEPEEGSKVDIVHTIPKEDLEQIKDIHSGKTRELPRSLVRSIDWFFLASASMRELGYKKPVSMLVHTSHIINNHEKIAGAIADYLIKVYQSPKEYFKKLEVIYNNESVDFTRNDFLNGMENYSSPQNVPDYPEWEAVLKQLKRVMSEEKDRYLSHIPLGEDETPKYHRGFHLVIDNSRTKSDDQIVRLVYPEKKLNFASMFIVIGGNTLSRGLTLEGLTSSYFVRLTSQADSLMQMGRWFGFRKGYEIFPRIWLDSLAKERFIFISQLNEELRQEIFEMSSRGQTPIDYQVRVKNSPNRQFIRITSDSKMQSAKATDLDFTGFNKQTVYFTNEETELKYNLDLTEKFLNYLAVPDVESHTGRMIWREVNYSKIRNFLQKFIFCEKDIAFSNIDALLKWYDKAENKKAFSEWSVVLSSVGEIKKYNETEIPLWNIQGYAPVSVTRTRRGEAQNDGKTVSIGALRTPRDLYVDVPSAEVKGNMSAEITKVRSFRKEHGYGLVPQLLLYRIDKGNMSEEEYRLKNSGSKERYPLNFDEDVIGMNIMIPGFNKAQNIAQYVNLKPNFDNYDNYDDYETIEKEEYQL